MTSLMQTTLTHFATLPLAGQVLIASLALCAVLTVAALAWAVRR